MQRWAEFSECGRFRWLLGRRWGDSSGYALCIGCNPSIASGEIDDPTAVRVRNFVDREGLHEYRLVNTSAFVTTDPGGLLAMTHEERQIDRENNLSVIEREARGASLIIAMSGAHKVALAKGPEIWRALANYPVYALGTTKAGAPKHPLYLRSDTPLVPFNVMARSIAG